MPTAMSIWKIILQQEMAMPDTQINQKYDQITTLLSRKLCLKITDDD